MGDRLTREEVLAMVPQQEPFRFIDEIVELDAEPVAEFGEHRSRIEQQELGIDDDRLRTGGEHDLPGTQLPHALARTCKHRGARGHGTWCRVFSNEKILKQKEMAFIK